VSLVIDSSMTLSWYFEDERTPARIAVLNQVAGGGAVVPAHWRLEVLSALQVAVRRRRITIGYRDASLADLRALAITVDRSTNRQAWSATLRLCDRFGLTPYDGRLSRTGAAPPTSIGDARRRAGAGGAGRGCAAGRQRVERANRAAFGIQDRRGILNRRQ